ncbi:MAG: hypothetical protein ACSHWU_08560 [Marinicella sp.]
MKFILLMIVFCCGSLAQSIDDRAVRNFGYWPIDSAYTHNAVIPIINKKILSQDNVDLPDSLSPDPFIELMQAGAAAIAGLTPQIIMEFTSRPFI